MCGLLVNLYVWIDNRYSVRSVTNKRVHGINILVYKSNKCHYLFLYSNCRVVLIYLFCYNSVTQASESSDTDHSFVSHITYECCDYLNTTRSRNISHIYKHIWQWEVLRFLAKHNAVPDINVHLVFYCLNDHDHSDCWSRLAINTLQYIVLFFNNISKSYCFAISTGVRQKLWNWQKVPIEKVTNWLLLVSCKWCLFSWF